MKFIKYPACLLLMLSVCTQPVYSGVREDAVAGVIEDYLPGVTGFGDVDVKSVAVNTKRRVITVKLSENGAYIPFTASRLADFKNDIRKALGAKYAKYKVNITAKNKNLDRLVLFGKKKNIGPTEQQPFIVREGKEAAPAGLDGKNIALWQSHGWYYEQTLDRWEWQRARMFGTVEDLYTQSYVLPFLIPMLENAGAYVMSPRERDVNTVEIIVDNDRSDFTKGTFNLRDGSVKESTKGFAYTKRMLVNGDRPFDAGTAVSFSDGKAVWDADVPEAGSYAVYVSYATTQTSSDAAQYSVTAADGEHNFKVNQQMGGGTWIYLGHFPFDGKVEIALVNGGSPSSSVSADAVKIGGGMGNVGRKPTVSLPDIESDYTVSGYPRFTEGSRYFLQWAGAPDSVYSPTEYENDYIDDYRSRGLWVNWLAGGSSMLPGKEGLKIPVDLSLAFHSDAGTFKGDTIVGTLGIYSTAGDRLANGSDRLASRDYTDLVMTNIVNDVRAFFEPDWARRGMWDKQYAEARAPEVPAMLLELLSHQNFFDMSYGLDPTFRFVVSRAIYKGMLKFLAKRDNRSCVVQPLPIKAFAINSSGNGRYTLSWSERKDKFEPSATPSYYIIEERTGNGAFHRVARVSDTSWTTTITDSDIHSYRIIAGNDGGTSFPSEVLALCNMPGKQVLIVNGFTRVSAPDRFDSGAMAGFYNDKDGGVPYIKDISFTGKQFEFRRDRPWVDDDNTGFGDSRSNFETKVIAGNTFDYVYTHGLAIAAAGHGFISSSAEAFVSATDTPELVDIIFGKQKEIIRGRGAYGTDCKTFTPEMQQRIKALTASGTDFFISGSYVATDLWDNEYSSPETAKADQAFARDILGYAWRESRAAVEGGVHHVPSPYRAFGKGKYTFNQSLGSECYVVESPDGVMPADNSRGATVLRYDENNISAASAFDSGIYKTVVIGFPFETMQSEDQRNLLMKQILDFFK